MKKLINVCLMVAFFCSLTSCASIINGRRQEVEVTSNPVGASVSDGTNTWTTPAKISLSRKSAHVLTFSKPGYEPQMVKVENVISGAVAGNLVFLPFAGIGLVGWGIDALSGAQYKLVPDTVCATLHPSTGTAGIPVAKAE